MNSDKKFALLVLGIPLAGLVYCGLGITAMASSMTVRTHPIVSGTIFILLPLSIADTILLAKVITKSFKHNLQGDY